MALATQQYQQQTQNDLAGAPGFKTPKTYSVNDFQSWAQNRYGQQANQGQLSKIAQHVGYTGDGSDISEDQWNKATQYSDTLAKQQGWQQGANQTPTTPYTPGPGVAPPVLAASARDVPDGPG